MDETHIRGAWYKKRSSNHSLQHAPGAWYKKCSRKHRPPSRQSLFWRHLVTCAIATVAALSLTPDLVVCFLTTWALGTRFKIWPNTTPCNRFSKLRTGNPHTHTHYSPSTRSRNSFSQAWTMIRTPGSWILFSHAWAMIHTPGHWFSTRPNTGCLVREAVPSSRHKARFFSSGSCCSPST